MQTYIANLSPIMCNNRNRCCVMEKIRAGREEGE